MTDRIDNIKCQMLSMVEGQMGNLQCVDAKELGEVIDIIKDLEEAKYYCTITKAMEEKAEQPSQISYYFQESNPRRLEPYYMDRERDMDRYNNRMYYSSGSSGNSSSSSSGSSGSGGRMGSAGGRGGSAYYWDESMMDDKYGRSPSQRKMYMESKHNHKDQQTQMRELEKYMTELSGDITEMINGATPEEKQMLQQKLNTLANKIV